MTAKVYHDFFFGTVNLKNYDSVYMWKSKYPVLYLLF